MTCSPARVVTDVSMIKVEENGRCATFINKERLKYHRVKVDGGLKKNELCADYVVHKPSVGSVVVELKGTDVGHAVDQINATLVIMQACAAPDGKGGARGSKHAIAGLIVCSRFPQADTTFQRKQKQFVKQHKSPLHCVSGRGEFVIEKVLSFNGPK